MTVGSVSFGSVVAVSGKPPQVRRLEQCLAPYERSRKIVRHDITSNYMCTGSNGALARAAAKGDKVDLFITGKDVQRINREPHFTEIGDIIGSLRAYFCVDTRPVEESVTKLLSYP